MVERIIEAAARLTTGQLNALIRRVCVQADPDDAANRYREAVDGRRVVVEPSVDGTAHLFGLDLPPDRVAAAMRRIADLAQTLKTVDETRTFDQIRADVFLDLLEGTRHARGWERNRRHPRRPGHLGPAQPTIPASWPDTGRSSPTSPAKSQKTNRTPNGVGP